MARPAAAPPETPPGSAGPERPPSSLLGRALVAASFAFTVGAMLGPAEHPLGTSLFGAALLLSGSGALAKRRPVAPLLLGSGAFFLGLLATAARVPREDTVSAAAPHLDAPRVWLEGRVAEAPELGLEADALILDVTATSTVPGAPLQPGRARVRVRIPRAGTGPEGGDAEALRPEPMAQAGDRVRVEAALHARAPELMPHLRSRRLAVRRGVALAGEAAGPGALVVLERAADRDPLGRATAALGALRRRAAQAIVRVLDTDEPSAPARARLLAALATGERAGLPRATEARWFAAGFTPLFSLVGLSMTVLVAGVGALAARRLERRRWGALAAAPLVVLAVSFFGASPTMVRLGLLLVGATLGVGVLALDAWSGVALGVLASLAWSPAGLGDVAFQLPFAALAALLRTYPALRDAGLRRLPSGARRVRGPLRALAAGLALAVGTTPLIARLFDRVSVGTLAANALAIPLAGGVAAPLGLLGGLLATLSEPLGAPLIQLGARVVQAVDALAGALATPGGVRIPTPSLFECALFYLATTLLSAPAGGRGAGARPPRLGARALGLGALALLATSMVGGHLLGGPQGELRAAFLPTAKGRAVVLETPEGAVVAMSSAPPSAGFDLGERVVASHLKLHRHARATAVLVLEATPVALTSARDLVLQLDAEEVWWAGRAAELPEATRRWVAAADDGTAGDGARGARPGRVLGEAPWTLEGATFTARGDGGVEVRARGHTLTLTADGGGRAGAETIDAEPAPGRAGPRFDTRAHGLVTVTLGDQVTVRAFRPSP